MSDSNLISALEWRYAVKSFDAQKKLTSRQWSELEKSLLLTPSSFGLQPWQFLVVTNQDLKNKLREYSWNQTQVSDCSHFLVLAAQHELTEADISDYVQSIAQTRQVPFESLAGYKQMMVGSLLNSKTNIFEWASRQCYIALGQFMLACAQNKIDACPMEGITPAKFDEMLGLTVTPYKTTVACAVGFRSETDAYSQAKKVRFSRQKLVKEFV